MKGLGWEIKVSVEEDLQLCYFKTTPAQPAATDRAGGFASTCTAFKASLLRLLSSKHRTTEVGNTRGQFSLNEAQFNIRVPPAACTLCHIGSGAEILDFQSTCSFAPAP